MAQQQVTFSDLPDDVVEQVARHCARRASLHNDVQNLALTDRRCARAVREIYHGTDVPFVFPTNWEEYLRRQHYIYNTLRVTADNVDPATPRAMNTLLRLYSNAVASKWGFDRMDMEGDVDENPDEAERAYRQRAAQVVDDLEQRYMHKIVLVPADKLVYFLLDRVSMPPEFVQLVWHLQYHDHDAYHAVQTRNLQRLVLGGQYPVELFMVMCYGVYDEDSRALLTRLFNAVVDNPLFNLANHQPARPIHASEIGAWLKAIPHDTWPTLQSFFFARSPLVEQLVTTQIHQAGPTVLAEVFLCYVAPGVTWASVENHIVDTTVATTTAATGNDDALSFLGGDALVNFMRLTMPEQRASLLPRPARVLLLAVVQPALLPRAQEDRHAAALPPPQVPDDINPHTQACLEALVHRLQMHHQPVYDLVFPHLPEQWQPQQQQQAFVSSPEAKRRRITISHTDSDTETEDDTPDDDNDADDAPGYGTYDNFGNYFPYDNDGGMSSPRSPGM